MLASYHYTNDRENIRKVLRTIMEIVYNILTMNTDNQPAKYMKTAIPLHTSTITTVLWLAILFFLQAQLKVAYEWTIHNAAYNIFSLGGDNNYVASAKDVDVGKTIFADTGHDFMSKMMITGFQLFHPYQAASDLLIYLDITS